MRVLIAPDKFAGTLTAPQAAEAIARGWSRRAPHDELDLAPMSDGGPGFVECLHRALGGELKVVTVAGPHGRPTPATLLVVEDTAYVESAQAIGLHLVEPGDDPEAASSLGLGQLLAAALTSDVRRVVVGVGGTATNDGGAGMLAALGATATGGRLDAGAAGLVDVSGVDLDVPREKASGREIVLASDVDNQLAGLFGATKIFGPQKGISEERIYPIDALLQTWGELLDRKLAAAKGAGAGGGVGFALMLLGAERVAGVGTIAEALGLLERMRKADLVITGEGAFDFSSRSGKVPYGVAELAAECLLPCIALAGQVLIGSREMRALGIESAYSTVDLVGAEASMARPGESLEQLAERVARSWSRGTLE